MASSPHPRSGGDPTLRILARGVDWICVDKPAGLLVHRTALAHYERDTVVARLTAQLDTKVFPVHRLDRPTSGCLWLGLSSDGARRVQLALSEGTKTYLALVRGQADDVDGTRVERPLKPEGGGEAKEAVTNVQILASSPDPRCSLVLARPETGRYHQVRRHLRGLNHPVLMDSTHGDTRCNAQWRERGLTRLALHCMHVSVSLDDEAIEVVSPLPPDLALLRDLPCFPKALESGPVWLGAPR